MARLLLLSMMIKCENNNVLLFKCEDFSSITCIMINLWKGVKKVLSGDSGSTLGWYVSSMSWSWKLPNLLWSIETDQKDIVYWEWSSVQKASMLLLLARLVIHDTVIIIYTIPRARSSLAPERRPLTGSIDTRMQHEQGIASTQDHDHFLAHEVRAAKLMEICRLVQLAWLLSPSMDFVTGI